MVVRRLFVLFFIERERAKATGSGDADDGFVLKRFDGGGEDSLGGEPPPAACPAIRVHMQRLALSRARQWGACRLALELREGLALGDFWRARRPPSREKTLVNCGGAVAYSPPCEGQ